MAPAPLFLVSGLPLFVTLSFLVIKNSFPLFDSLPSSFLCLPSPPGAGLLYFSLFFPSFLPSLLPPSIPSSFPSLPSISPTLHFRLAPSTRAVDSPHTQRDLSLFTTRHHWHNLLTATLNYFCTLAACRILLACQTASSFCRGGKKKKQAPFLDGDQGGALDRLFLAQC